jgi:hypothetical protein
LYSPNPVVIDTMSTFFGRGAGSQQTNNCGDGGLEFRPGGGNSIDPLRKWALT